MRKSIVGLVISGWLFVPSFLHAAEIKPCDAARIIVRLTYIQWSCAGMDLTATGKKFLRIYQAVPRWRSCEKQAEDAHSHQVQALIYKHSSTLLEAYRHVCLIDALAFKKVTGKDFARVVK